MTYNEAHKQAIYKYRLKNLENARQLNIISKRNCRESNPQKYKEYERQRYLWKTITQTFRNILIE